MKPANQKEYRRDRRYARNQSRKRKVVVIVRERGGNSVPMPLGSESQVVAFRTRIAMGTVVHADEAASWDGLHERFEIKRINHQEAYSLNGACTIMAEEIFRPFVTRGNRSTTVLLSKHISRH